MKNLSRSHPIWFCDIWGVVHNGYAPFARTCAALAAHRQSGGIVILVTNSPRTSAGVVTQLDDIGVARDTYDAAVTSGDVTQTLMVQYGGGQIYHIGPARDYSIYDGLNIKRVDLQHAKAVLCTGLFDEVKERPQDYVPLLREVKSKNIPFISANPDKIVRKGDHLIYCAGAVADEFIKIGGEVLMAGKPFAPIYELAVKKAEQLRKSEVAKSYILAIGDGPETDIKGAADFGLDCLLITGGINSGADILKAVQEAVPHAHILADMPELDWH
jgi:HAD superfamily hydrolase (TIGR01459 family)